MRHNPLSIFLRWYLTNRHFNFFQKNYSKGFSSGNLVELPNLDSSRYRMSKLPSLV